LRVNKVKKEEAVARTYEPMGDRVLVRPIDREDVSPGGIFLPDTAKEKPQEGEIIAVGPGRLTEDGSRVPMDLKKGELVLYAKYGGTEIKEDGTDYLMLSERDILAKVNG
jgi:chaperonin GroES